jgi:hypothetical protein
MFPPASFSSTKLEQRLKNRVHLSLLAGQPKVKNNNQTMFLAQLFKNRPADQKNDKLSNIRIRHSITDSTVFKQNPVAQLC